MSLLTESKNGESLDRLGPTAVVSYLNIAVFTLTVGGLFYLLWSGTKIESVWAGLLGAILGSSGGALATTNQFWLGGNIGSKTATNALKQIATTPTTQNIAPSATMQTNQTASMPTAAVDEFAIPDPPSTPAPKGPA